MEKHLKRECHKIFNFTHEGGDQPAQHQPHHFHPLLLQQGERMEKHLKRECHKIFNFAFFSLIFLVISHYSLSIQFYPYILLLQGERMEKHLKKECHKIFNFTFLSVSLVLSHYSLAFQFFCYTTSEDIYPLTFLTDRKLVIGDSSFADSRGKKLITDDVDTGNSY
jgi:hypothetical protein